MKGLLVFCLLLLLLVPTALAAEEAIPVETSGWAHEDVEKAIDLNIMYGTVSAFSDTRAPITRGDFAVNATSLAALEFGSNLESYLLIMGYREQAERDEYLPLYPLHVAERLGIIRGRGEDEEDSSAYITRQEAAVMLARTYRTYQDTVPNVLEALSFVDRDEIGSWALDDVRLMNHLGIMTGVGEGRFDPLGSYTIEQCLVSLVRLHEKAPYDGSKQENPFAVSKLEGGFFRTWDEHYGVAFAIETEDYYICALDRSVAGNGLGPSYYDINIVDQDLSLRSYPTPILMGIGERGGVYARPENPAISEDGTKLFYTGTLKENAYDLLGHTGADKTLMFEKGVYTVTMDLATGEQTWTRADLA